MNKRTKINGSRYGIFNEIRDKLDEVRQKNFEARVRLDQLNNQRPIITPLKVVSALIVNAYGDVLIGKREICPYPHIEFKDMWEFPGGKVERGETPEQAIVREIWEELGCEFVPQHRCARNESIYSNIAHKYIDILFISGYIKGYPTSHVHKELAWVSPKELMHWNGDYELLETNRIAAFTLVTETSRNEIDDCEKF